MSRVAVITDSTCCLPADVVKKYDIKVVPLEIIYQEKSYRDGIDITPGEVYQIMRMKENLPTTSTPAVGDFLEVYRKAAKQAESILCITLTSLQSQTFQAAMAAKGTIVTLTAHEKKAWNPTRQPVEDAWLAKMTRMGIKDVGSMLAEFKKMQAAAWK